MGDRLSAHIRSLQVSVHIGIMIGICVIKTNLAIMQTVRWDIPKEGDGVNDYMELLVKETVTLHKVLSRYLSLSVVEVRYHDDQDVHCFSRADIRCSTS